MLRLQSMSLRASRILIGCFRAQLMETLLIIPLTLVTMSYRAPPSFSALLLRGVSLLVASLKPIL